MNREGCRGGTGIRVRPKNKLGRRGAWKGISEQTSIKEELSMEMTARSELGTMSHSPPAQGPQVGRVCSNLCRWRREIH